MFANTKTLLALVSVALLAQAQSSTTATAPASQSSLPAGLDPCIVTCATEAAASAGCASYTDLSCVCTSTAFQQDALACLQANCTAADVQAAAQLQTQECAALSSGSVPASTAASTGSSASASASATGSSTTSSASHAATSSSAAMALSAPFSFGSLVGTLVASAGALVGAAIIL